MWKPNPILITLYRQTQYLLLFITKPNTYYSLSPNPILITLYHKTQYLLLFITKPNIYYSLSSGFSTIFLSAVQQPNSIFGCLIFEVSNTIRRTHANTHTQYSVALLCTSDQPVGEAATCTTHNKHKRPKSFHSAGFEPVIPGIRRFQSPLGLYGHRDRP